jgi:hypothetical protein
MKEIEVQGILYLYFASRAGPEKMPKNVHIGVYARPNTLAVCDIDINN